MTAEDIVRDALAHLADGHVFEDVADQGVRLPWIVYQVAGGKIYVDLSGNAYDKCCRRVQVAVWHGTAKGRSSLMRQVVRALVNPEVGAIPIGAPNNVFERETRLYGSRLDVSVSVEF
ncbi:DUF3168 domain-containing protein [Caballeronia sp. LZ035]|uniref:tail completion protein gp17 n=1 Tax=Caballeronia sp. LZ035 TaxID=3038568 RepID=UPI00285BCA25|nr:DUF3168 domain-containing protein [Caballeronia sp. LZ035]MDR5756500.1 DUF3168 domain-containing protein [Caballeronia sp. LZ035]